MPRSGYSSSCLSASLARGVCLSGWSAPILFKGVMEYRYVCHAFLRHGRTISNEHGVAVCNHRNWARHVSGASCIVFNPLGPLSRLPSSRLDCRSFPIVRGGRWFFYESSQNVLWLGFFFRFLLFVRLWRRVAVCVMVAKVVSVRRLARQLLRGGDGPPGTEGSHHLLLFVRLEFENHQRIFGGFCFGNGFFDRIRRLGGGILLQFRFSRGHERSRQLY